MIKPAPLKNRIRRFLWLSIILVVSILFLINGIFLIRYKPILDQTLKKMVLDQSKGLYSIRFNSSSSQILLGKIVLEEVNIQPNSKKLEELTRNKTLPCRIYQVQIKNIEIYFTNLSQIIWKNNLDIHLVKLMEPNFTIILSSQPCSSEVPSFRNSSDLKKPRLKSIRIEHLLIDSGKIQVFTPDMPGRPLAFSGSNIHLNAGSFLWNDSHSNNGPVLKILQYIPFSMIMNNAQWISPHGDYRVLSNRIYYSNQEGIMEIAHCQGNLIRDNHSKSDPIPNPKGIFFNLNYIALNHFNWPLLLLGESFQVDTVLIHTGDLGIRDEPQSPQIKLYRPLPQEWLKKINLPVDIKNIGFKDLNIHYQETHFETEKTGSLEFLHSDGEIQNIHNHFLKLPDKDSIHIQLHSLLFGHGNLNITMAFDMNSNQNDFNLKAQLNQFPLTDVNSMSLPLAGIKVTGGIISELNFSMQGNKEKSFGKLNARYRNLRLKFLVQGQEKDPKKIKTLSSLANTFLILNDNPLSGEKERFSDYSFIRNPNRSFFNYLWKSLFSGLKPIMGITTDRENSISAFIQQLHSFQKWDHELKPGRLENRRIRRQKRILKRLQKGLNNRLLNTY